MAAERRVCRLAPAGQATGNARYPAAAGMHAPLQNLRAPHRFSEVAVRGGISQTVATLPFDEIGSVSMTPEGRRFVCTVYSSSSDVWIVDDFDAADVRAARR